MSQGEGRFVHGRKMCGRVRNILVVIPRKFIGMWIELNKEISIKFLKWARKGSNNQPFEYDIWDT